MIKFENVWKKYGYTVALRNVNLVFDEPSSNLIIGPNGSGKTTMLKMICGLVKPSKGHVEVFGVKPHIDLKRVMKFVSFFFEDDPLPWWETGRDYIEMLSRIIDYDLDEIRDLILGLKINEFWDKKIYTYSSGMRRKIQILKAFIGYREVIILDEPLTLLDRESKKFLIDFLGSEFKDRYLLISSHIDEGLSEVADRIIYVENGEIGWIKNVG